MLDHILFLLEIVLLGIVVWQGELIRRYEKWTYEMNRERWDERAKWREQKRQQQLKKIENALQEDPTRAESKQ